MHQLYLALFAPETIILSLNQLSRYGFVVHIVTFKIITIVFKHTVFNWDRKLSTYYICTYINIDKGFVASLLEVLRN
jgi:hypothetical protein